MLQYENYARLFDGSQRLSDYTAKEIAIGLMYRYESADGSLDDDVDMLSIMCGVRAEVILLECLRYVRKVYTSHSWQYYNVLFETAWVFFRNNHINKAVDYFRAAVISNYDVNHTKISPLDSYYIYHFTHTSNFDGLTALINDKKVKTNPNAYIDTLKNNTCYTAGTRNNIMHRHLMRAAQAFEAGGFFPEAEALYKKLCDERLKYGDLYGLEQTVSLCRVYIRMGELSRAEAYCSAAENVVRASRKASADIIEGIHANRAALLFLNGDFQSAYRLLYQSGKRCFALEQKIDFEVLFDYILFLATGKTRNSRLEDLQYHILTSTFDNAHCIFKLLLGLNVENRAAATELFITLKTFDKKQAGKYFDGLYNYYYALLYLRQNPEKALAMLRQAELYFSSQRNTSTGNTFPFLERTKLWISIIGLSRGEKSIDGVSERECGVVFSWISSISHIDVQIARGELNYAVDDLKRTMALLHKIKGISVKLYAVGEYLKRYIAVFSKKGTLLDARKAELTEYIEALNECISVFGSQKDFGMNCSSSGDDDFLDEYLSELSELYD